MPPLAIAAVGALGGAALAGFTTTAVIGAILSVGLAAIQMVTTPKPKDAPRQPRRSVVRSSTAPRQVVYGETMIKDPVLIHFETTENDRYLHLFLAYAGHEIDGFGDILFNDEVIKQSDIDDDGDVISGRFSGFARIKQYLGTDDQAADADAISELSDWSSTDQGLGIAYIYVRLKGSATKFPNGIPRVAAVVRGKKVQHYATPGYRWSNNAALCAYDYLLSTDYGFGAPLELVDEATVAEFEAVCDQMPGVAEQSYTATVSTTNDEFTLSAAGLRTGDKVTVAVAAPTPLDVATAYYWIRTGPKTGKVAASLEDARTRTAIVLTADNGDPTITRIGQPRYTIDGSFLTSERPLDILDQLVGSMAGTPQLNPQSYDLRPGADRAVAGTITEDSLRGPMKVTPRRRRADLYNAVGGTFINADNFYTPDEFPEVASTVFAGQDGGRIRQDVEFDFLDDAQRAQRIALIDLAQSRQAMTVQWPGNLSLLRYERGDLINVQSARMGWEPKKFWVVRDAFATDDIGYDLTLLEYADGLFDDTIEQIEAFDPAPDSNLIIPGTLTAPSSVTLRTRPVATSGSDFLYMIEVFGVASVTNSVTRHNAQVFLAGDQEYENPIAQAIGDLPLQIGPVEATVELVVRLRAETWRGVTSDWTDSASFNAATESVGGTAPSAPSGFANTYEVEDVQDINTAGDLTFSGGGGSGAAGSAEFDGGGP